MKCRKKEKGKKEKKKIEKRNREKKEEHKKRISNRGGSKRDTLADLNECRENPAEFIGILEFIENTST